MDNYKGLYYKESKEQRFYEAGAHFSYKELYDILVYLKEEQDKKQMLLEQKKENQQNKNNTNNKNSILMSGLNSQYIDLIQNNNTNNAGNANKNKPRTRNMVNPCFHNNPNSKIKQNLNKSNNQFISIGLSYNDKKQAANSRNNNKNDFNLFYNRTSNHINNNMNLFQDTNLSGIKNKNNLSNFVHKKVLNKNNSTNQIKSKKIKKNNYLFNINNEINNLNEKNKRNDSYILNSSNKKNLLKKKNIVELNKNNSINISKKARKVNSISNKINNININSFINNGESYKKHRNNSSINGQMSINNYINININNNNNINLNMNNVSYQNNNHSNNKNKQSNINQVLMSLIRLNNKKYKNKNDKKEKHEKKYTDSFYDYLKTNKSRNINQKIGLCHVKSMDYNNKPLNTDLMGSDNNTFYDKTFTNNNKLNNNISINNNNCMINMPTLGKKLNWNYSYIKMRKDNTKKNNSNISYKPNKKGNKVIISKDIIKNFNLKNNNNYNININVGGKRKNQKNGTKNMVIRNNHINFVKYNMNNAKFSNEQILSKYYGYFKKINK